MATAQSFVIGLCALLNVERPHATAGQDYMFERPVSFGHGDGSTSTGRIDCYRRGCFVLEAKKLKVGAGMTAKEESIHDTGLVAVLKSLRDQLAAVARILGNSSGPQTEAQLAANFTGKGRWKSRLPDILAALEALGRARTTSGGWVAG